MNTEELLTTVVEYGECEFVEVDDANIPVNIFLTKDEDNPPAGQKWQLTADNFMSRKGRESDSGYKAVAPTREALVKVIEKYIMPLYKIAILNLQTMIDGTNDSLYYWDHPKKG